MPHEINIACPKCNTPMEDRFSCRKSTITANGLYFMEMECLNCDLLFTVEIITKWKQAMPVTPDHD